MKAPVNIYLQENTTTDCYEEFYPEWFEARARKSDIKYIRTDAFIDKACEWLEKNACNYEYSGGTCDSWFSASDLVESFRKYMEEQQ